MTDRLDDTDPTAPEPVPLGDLAHELDPDPALEERVVLALRHERLLQPAARSPRVVPVPIALAAAIVLFIFGLLIGFGAAPERSVDRSAAEPAEREPAADVRIVFWL